MSAEIINNFKKFDFSSNEKWQAYFDNNIYPIPEYQQIEKIKRKWYKSNIDP